MVKSFASNLFNSTRVPVRVSVNKLDFVQKWIIATLSKPGRRPRRRQPKVTTALLNIIYIFYPFKPHSFEGESLLMSIALTLDHTDDFRFVLLPSREKKLTAFSEARRAKFPPWLIMGKLIKIL